MVTTRFVSSLALVATLAVLCPAQRVELLDFYLPTCGPCRAMEPVVAQLESNGVSVRRIDGSRDPALVARLRIESYPTFVAVADGREAGRVVGATTYDDLARLVRSAHEEAAVRPASHTFAAGAGGDSSFARVGDDRGAGRPAASYDRPAGAGDIPLLAASVRLTVVGGNSKSYGTGTVVDARSGEALIVTCAHLFRGTDGRLIDPAGRLTVELFDVSGGAPRVAEQVAAQLVSHDFDADVALVAIRPSGSVASAPVASSVADLRVGDAVRSVGCDLGADPTVRSSRVVDLDRYDGPPNVEASGAPVQGRSGGGLFNSSGALVGVCNFADDAADEGIYAGLASIHGQLDRIGLSELYRGGTAAGPTTAVAAATLSPPAETPTRPLAPIARTPVLRGQDPAPAATLAEVAPLTSTEEASLTEIVSRGERAEVVVLIRPDAPGARTEVLTIDTASPEFVAALRRLGGTR